ncbi:hypothetical protein KAT08_01485 [Candidatus Babeliales bacterium]|nr:hypothetical protein [Candidatus Babeliales bacterium]
MKNLLKNHIFLSLFTFIITFSSIMPTNKTKDSLKDLIDFYSMTTKKDVLALTPYFKKASEIPLFSSMTDKEKKEWDDIATQIKNYSTKLQNIDKEIKKIFATTDNEINKLRNNKTKILKKLSPEYKELQEKIDLINKIQDEVYNLYKERQKIVSKIKTNQKYKEQILPIETQILKLKKQSDNLWSQPSFINLQKQHSSIKNKIRKLTMNKLLEIFRKMKTK